MQHYTILFWNRKVRLRSHVAAKNMHEALAKAKATVQNPGAYVWFVQALEVTA